ncbi:MAG: exostosin family protein [Henriciella sp.]|nr:exostosin family protein [Henriciella sp.]
MGSGEHTDPKSLSGHRAGAIHAYSKHWQRPAATEETALLRLQADRDPLGFEYLGFAWATLMDGLKERTSESKDILQALLQTHQSLGNTGTRKRATVAQHIRAINYFDLFKAIGITDVFWSHAVNSYQTSRGIRIHPFPLYPAQAPEYDGSETSEKRYLANFVGAYNPNIYLTNVRDVIFGDEGKYADLHIIKRDRWHFDRVVYDEQIGGRAASDAQLETEAQNKQDYIDAIRQSWFTLCPTGSGPNSIRIFECLALGSIPIVLSRELSLVGDQDLWDRAAIIEEDSEDGYRRAIERARRMPDAERVEMLSAGKVLFDQVGPHAFGNIIQQGMA